MKKIVPFIIWSVFILVPISFAIGYMMFDEGTFLSPIEKFFMGGGIGILADMAICVICIMASVTVARFCPEK